MYFHLNFSAFLCISSDAHWQNSFRRGGSWEVGSSIGQGQPRRVYSEPPIDTHSCIFPDFCICNCICIFIQQCVSQRVYCELPSILTLVFFLVFVFAIVLVSVFVFSNVSRGVCIEDYLL